MTPAHEHHTPVTTNGKGVTELDELYNYTYTDPLDDEMAGTSRANNDERISEILEGQHTLTLEIRASNIAAQQQATAINRLVDQLGNGKDKTALPNWLMPILFSVLFVFIGFVYTTIISRIDEAKAVAKAELERQDRQIDKLIIYMQNSREWIKEHGYEISEEGKISKRK